MEESETRSALLHRGMSPFAGKRFSKKDAKKEQRLAGRGRTAFPRESLVTLFGAQLFLNPPDMSPSNDPAVQVGQAKFRSIPIGLRSDAVFPAWQGMHYLRNMASGRGKLDPLDNDRHGVRHWQTAREVLALTA